jgi:acyl carrier protein
VSSSFLLIETIIELQEDFGVRFSQEEFAGITTVGQLVTLFVRQLEAEPDSRGRSAT